MYEILKELTTQCSEALDNVSAYMEISLASSHVRQKSQFQQGEQKITGAHAKQKT